MRNGPPAAGPLGEAESSLDQKQGGPRLSSREERPSNKSGPARLDSRADALLAVRPSRRRAAREGRRAGNRGPPPRCPAEPDATAKRLPCAAPIGETRSP